MMPENHALPEAGDLIGGRFRILEVLGTGGFGTVYKALQENIGRDVALKFLTPGVAKDPINVERFRREAFHVSQLRHPNTITLYDYGQTEDGLAYMVMEYLDGISLSDLIQSGNGIPWPRAAHIFIQVLKSLSEAHRHGLVHRDLKPENIFLCELFGEQDYVKVLDFGVAKMTLAEADEESDEEDLTRAGRIFGTPLYMAPEQACAEPITPATDVYALGLLLFEITTGQPPVTGRNRMDVIHKQIRDPVPILTDELRGTPMGELIRKACEKEPEHRFPDAPTLLEGFYRALAQMQVVPAPKGGGRPEMSMPHMTVPPAVQDAHSRRADTTEESSVIEEAVFTPAPKGVEIDHAALSEEDSDPTELFEPVELEHLPEVAVEHGPPRVEIRRIGRAEEAPGAGTPSHPFQMRTHSRPRFDLPLIGRDREFDKLTGLARSAGQMSTGQMVLVEGEGGVGKTHLLHAAMSALSDEGVDFSSAAFRRRSLPMEALREAIAGLWGVSHSERMEVDRVVRGDLNQLGGFSEREIDSLIEFLRPRASQPPPEIAGSEAGVLYARLERLLIRLAERRTILLCLEDIQYADGATLAFLEYLAVTVRTHACPIVVFMSMRPEERGLNPDLDQNLHTISSNIGVGFTRIRLRRLSGRALAVFLDSILPLEPRLKERVGWLCQGVPLHAIQIIRYLQNEGNLQKEGERWRLKSGNPRTIDLPPDLMELMALRIKQAVTKHKHRPHLHRILQWLAVLGMRVPVELLKMVINHAENFDDNDLERDLHALSEEAICRQSVHKSLICVEFENSLLREALLDEIREQWSTRNLHRVAAQQKVAFYEERQTEVPLVEIADHWRRAGEMERYRDTLAASCRRSMERFDLRGARERYRELIALLENQNLREHLWTEAHLALADLARRFGEFGLAEDHYRRVVESGEASGTEKSRALRGFGHLLTIQSRYKQATGLYSQALDWSQRINDPEGIAKALVGLSRVHLMQGDPRSGEKVRHRLESMLGEVQSPEVHGKVLLHLAEAAQRRGDLRKRYNYLSRAREALQRSSDRQGLGDALIALSSAVMSPSLTAPDRFTQAEETLLEAMELKRSLGDRHGVAEVFRHLGQLELERGNFEQAEGNLQRSLAIHQALGTPFNIGAAHNALGVLHVMTRRYESADQHFDASIDVFKRMGDQIAISQPLLNKGIVAINLRHFNKAQTYLREARRLKESLGTSWALFDLRNQLAIVNMWFGQFDTAERLLKETLAHVDRHGTAEDRAMARSLMGLLQCFQSRLQMAALELGRARADADDLNIERIRVFCRANAAFYALLTESHATYEDLVESVDSHNLLAELDRDVWLDLLAKMARFTAEKDRTRQSARLLRAAGTIAQRFGNTDAGQSLIEEADSLEKELAALND